VNEFSADAVARVQAKGMAVFTVDTGKGGGGTTESE